MCDWIETYTGKKFGYKDTTKDDICVVDIVHALSLLCRFGGHGKFLWTVAQHSLLVWKIVRDSGGTVREQLLALTHDFVEGYMVDIPKPLKNLLPQYEEMEKKIEQVILESIGLYGITEQERYTVKQADILALQYEAQKLEKNKTGWTSSVFGLNYRVRPQNPRRVEKKLLKTYLKLKKEFDKQNIIMLLLT